MNKSTLAIAIAALLVGGVAVAAFQHMRQPDTLAASAPADLATPSSLDVAADVAATDTSIPASPQAAASNAHETRERLRPRVDTREVIVHSGGLAKTGRPGVSRTAWRAQWGTHGHALLPRRRVRLRMGQRARVDTAQARAATTSASTVVVPGGWLSRRRAPCFTQERASTPLTWSLTCCTASANTLGSSVPVLATSLS